MLLSTCCFHAVGRVSPFPDHIRRWPIGRRHVSAQQPQIHRQLGAMMRGMQHPPPEDPNPLPFDIEEWLESEPPALVLGGKEFKPLLGQLDKSGRSRLQCEN